MTVPKFVSYDIVFQEIPGEVTLALNISNCPNRCRGCHSPHLMEDIGHELNVENISLIMEKYGSSISCICFMGGDAEPLAIEKLALDLRKKFNKKMAWYSGRCAYPVDESAFDFVKLGEFVEGLGGLNSPKTNQRFYRVENGRFIDATELFWKK